MTISILASTPVGSDTHVPARPHPRHAAVWTPFESVAWLLSLLLAVRRLGAEPGEHRRAAAAPQLTRALRRWFGGWREMVRALDESMPPLRDSKAGA
jgi:hypothetical protein